jgi:hypothetical protein
MGNHADLISCSGANGNGNNARQLQPQTTTGLPQHLLYPNPVSREHAVLNLQLAQGAGTVHLELRNALGQLVMEKEEQVGEGQNTLRIDLGSCDAGVYLLNVNHNGQLSAHRLLIE